MIKPVVFHLIFLFQFHLSFGQDSKPDPELSNLLKFDLGGQGIGFTYEPRLFNKMTADISAGIGGGYDIAEGFMEVNYGRPAFYFSLTPKYFYNRRSRIEKGKQTSFNAGNYLGLRLKYVTANYRAFPEYRNSILVNIHWGLQRPLGKHWAFNSHFGAGYAQDIDYRFGTIYPAIDFKFSYIFFQSKK
jgi:hypothetical protein